MIVLMLPVDNFLSVILSLVFKPAVPLKYRANLIYGINGRILRKVGALKYFLFF